MTLNLGVFAYISGDFLSSVVQVQIRPEGHEQEESKNQGERGGPRSYNSRIKGSRAALRGVGAKQAANERPRYDHTLYIDICDKSRNPKRAYYQNLGPVVSPKPMKFWESIYQSVFFVVKVEYNTYKGRTRREYIPRLQLPDAL